MLKTLALLVFAIPTFAATTLQITQPPSGPGDPLIRIQSDTDQPHVLEQSQTLKFWTHLTNGLITGGAFDHVHRGASNFPQLFYRAHAGAPEPQLNVTLHLDTNRFAVALITPDSGGICRLEIPNGPTYTLTIPAKSVLESVAIRMSLITNITGWPITEPPAAVRFEPEGLRFLDPGLLEIRYSTNLPPTLRASFGFNGDGSELYLTPDLITSNKVTISVAHFSGTASVPVTPQQAATFTRKSIQNAERRLSQELSARILADREAALTAESGASGTMPDIAAWYEQFYQNEIAPRLAQGFTSCDQARSVLRAALSVERQLQLFSQDTSHINDIMSGYCDALTLCFDEVRKECEAGGGPGVVSKLLSLNRERQLLGFSDSCGGPVGDINDCFPIWFGTIEYLETGATNYVEGSQNVTETIELRSFHTITNATEGINSSGITVNATLEGNGHYKYTETRTTPATGPCPRTFKRYEINEAGAGPFGQGLAFNISNNGALGQFFVVPGNLPNHITTTGTRTDSTIVTTCEGKESASSRIDPYNDRAVPMPVYYPASPQTHNLQISTNRIFGTFTIRGNQDYATTTVTVDLKRR